MDAGELNGPAKGRGATPSVDIMSSMSSMRGRWSSGRLRVETAQERLETRGKGDGGLIRT